MTSKYDRLADHLVATGEPRVTLTFDEVEAIIGPLPPSAHSYPGWWGATAYGCYDNVHAMHWRDAGYIADRPDFAAQIVTFRRVR